MYYSDLLFVVVVVVFLLLFTSLFTDAFLSEICLAFFAYSFLFFIV